LLFTFSAVDDFVDDAVSLALLRVPDKVSLDVALDASGAGLCAWQ